MKRFEPVLDPMDRISELLFGLIMVLTFTGSLSVAESSRVEVRDMLLGALGCNLAWGIIDAFMYLMARFNERARGLIALRAVRETTDAATAHRVIADGLPPLLASALRSEDLEILRERLRGLPEVPTRARPGKDDWLGAAAVFLLIFAGTLPVVIPFVFMDHLWLALRVSNGIAMVMLFLTGWAFGRETGRPPWRVGLWMVLIGAAMVGVTIALGG